MTRDKFEMHNILICYLLESRHGENTYKVYGQGVALSSICGSTRLAIICLRFFKWSGESNQTETNSSLRLCVGYIQLITSYLIE